MSDERDISEKAYSRRTALKLGGVTAGVALGGGVFSSAAGASPDKGAAESGKFQLHDMAEIINEPGVRPTNHVVKIDTSEEGYAGSASRKLGVTASDLDGLLSFDFYIVSGDTGGGSPRIALSVDNDGDGTHDGYIHGHVDPNSLGTPAAQQNWVSVDLTDGVARWETSQLGLGLPYVVPFSTVISNLGADHEILSGLLVDDSAWLSSAAGVAYYDNVAIGDRTLSGNSDVVGNR